MKVTMSDVGEVNIDGVAIYYNKDRPYVSSMTVKEQMRMIGYKPLYKRGLKSVNSEKYPELYQYFFKHRTTHGGRALLFPLKAMAAAEKDAEFEDVFKTDYFFTKLLDDYLELCQLNSVEDESDDIELFSSEGGSAHAPPRKQVVEPSNALLKRIELLEQNMMNQLREMQSAHHREMAIQALVQDSEVQKEAITIAAKDLLDEEGKTAILETFDKRHAAHVAAMEKKAADQEAIFKSAQESRKRTTEEERTELERVRHDIRDERRQLEDLTGKRRRLHDEMMELQRTADQRAAELHTKTFTSIASRAGKAPVVNAYMDSVFGRK